MQYDLKSHLVRNPPSFQRRAGVLASVTAFSLALVFLIAPEISAQTTCSGNCEVLNGDNAVQVGSFDNGDGTLLIEGGDGVTAPGGVYIGAFGASTGTATIRDDGSSVANGQDFTLVGFSGATGTLLIENGASLINDAAAVTPSFGQLQIGNGGTGRVDLLSGGSFVLDRSSQQVSAAVGIGLGNVDPTTGIGIGDGQLNINGGGSSLDVLGSQASIFVGGIATQGNGTGLLTIGNGGRATIFGSALGTGATTSSVSVGRATGPDVDFATGVGELNILGPGSTLELLGDSTALSIFSGDMSITAGGSTELSGRVSTVDIGTAFGGRDGAGALTVDGPGSVMQIGDGSGEFVSLRIGRAVAFNGEGPPIGSTGSLTISDAGLVEVIGTAQPVTFVGFHNINTGLIPRGTATGSLTVTTGGQFFTNGELAVGARGATGTLNISNGGVVLMDESATAPDLDPFVDLGIGVYGGSGTVTIDTGGSLLLREADAGELVDIAVGETDADGGASTGILRVIGSGSSFAADAENVSLTVANRGAGASGTIDVSAGAALTLNASSGTSDVLIGGEGVSASVQVSGAGSAFTVSGQSGAAVTLGGIASTLTINDAGILDISSAAGVGSLFVGDGGNAFGVPSAFLRGNGLVRVSNVVELVNGGVISPGNGPADLGTLSIDGDFVAQTGGILQIDALGNGSSDSLSITGTATLNGGTVQALSPDGDFSVARDYTILSASSVTGQFDAVTSNLDYLTPSLSYADTAVLLNLVRKGGDIQQDVLRETGVQELSVKSRTTNSVISNQVGNILATSLGFGSGGSASTTTTYAPGSFSTGLSAGDETSSGNLWLNFTPSRYETDTVLPGSNKLQTLDGQSYTLMLGFDKTLSERVIAGAIVGAEITDVDFGLIGGSQENDGLMLGAYTGVVINDYAYASFNGTYLWLDNSIEEAAFGSSELVRGQFDAQRYQIAAELNFVKTMDAYDFRWHMGASFMEETADDYLTSVGDSAQPLDQRLGRLSLGFTTRYAGETHRPYFSVVYENDLDSAVQLEDSQGFVSYAGIRSQSENNRLFFEAFVSAVVGREKQNHNMFGVNLTYLL